MPPRLMLGTRNRKKRARSSEILGDLGLEFGDLSPRPDVPDVGKKPVRRSKKRPP